MRRPRPSASGVAASRRRTAVAGAAAALTWAAAERQIRRVLRTQYSDVGLVGLPMHLANGAAFALAYRELRRRRDVPALAAVLAEHVALWPLVALLDRDAARDPRAFASSAAGHALFGLVLGRLLEPT
jgi:hypothetical protein